MILAEKYGVLEINLVTSRTDGDIKAQYPLAAEFDAIGGAQNGMLLVVDEIGQEIKLPTDETDYVYLHYSEEKVYDNLHSLKDFILTRKAPLPRLFKLVKGNTFTANTVDTGILTLDLLKARDYKANPVYGVCGANGLINLVTTEPTTAPVVLKIQKFYTMPDGSPGIKFVVDKA